MVMLAPCMVIVAPPPVSSTIFFLSSRVMVALFAGAWASRVIVLSSQVTVAPPVVASSIWLSFMIERVRESQRPPSPAGDTATTCVSPTMVASIVPTCVERLTPTITFFISPVTSRALARTLWTRSLPMVTASLLFTCRV